MRVESSVCLYSENIKHHVEKLGYYLLHFNIRRQDIKYLVSRNHYLCSVECVRVTPRVFLGKIRPKKHIHNVVGSPAADRHAGSM